MRGGSNLLYTPSFQPLSFESRQKVKQPLTLQYISYKKVVHEMRDYNRLPTLLKKIEPQPYHDNISNEELAHFRLLGFLKEAYERKPILFQFGVKGTQALFEGLIKGNLKPETTPP